MDSVKDSSDSYNNDIQCVEHPNRRGHRKYECCWCACVCVLFDVSLFSRGSATRQPNCRRYRIITNDLCIFIQNLNSIKFNNKDPNIKSLSITQSVQCTIFGLSIEEIHINYILDSVTFCCLDHNFEFDRCFLLSTGFVCMSNGSSTFILKCQIEHFSKFVLSISSNWRQKSVWLLINLNREWMENISARSKPRTFGNHGGDAISSPNVKILASKFNYFIKNHGQNFFFLLLKLECYGKNYIIFELVSNFHSPLVEHFFGQYHIPFAISNGKKLKLGEKLSVTQFLNIPSFVILFVDELKCAKWFLLAFTLKLMFQTYKIYERIHATERHFEATPKCQSKVVK